MRTVTFGTCEVCQQRWGCPWCGRQCYFLLHRNSVYSYWSWKINLSKTASWRPVHIVSGEFRFCSRRLPRVYMCLFFLSTLVLEVGGCALQWLPGCYDSRRWRKLAATATWPPAEPLSSLGGPEVPEGWQCERSLLSPGGDVCGFTAFLHLVQTGRVRLMKLMLFWKTENLSGWAGLVLPPMW